MVILLLTNLSVLASGETVCVITTNNTYCTATSLGYINPCSQLTFKVNTNPVAPFVYASKYEWLYKSLQPIDI